MDTDRIVVRNDCGAEFAAALDFDDDNELRVQITDDAGEYQHVYLTREQVQRVMLALAVALAGTANP